jgi:NAD(P)-dependent dehydrogenase (short-subunit alcohol dehydrogenase family)
MCCFPCVIGHHARQTFVIRLKGNSTMVKHDDQTNPRVAIVTGAGTGLGRAYAHRLAADGMRVVVNNRRREVDAAGRGSADHVVAEIVAAGGEAVANYEDVCAAGAGGRMLTQALATWGRLDALVNNAGVDQHASFHKIDLEAFRRIFEVNFFGTVEVTHPIWQHMRAAGHGRVVVSTSSAGLHGLHGLSAYASSKAALIGLARSLAAEGASRDLFCNAIAPYAATRMTSGHAQEGDGTSAMTPDLVAPLVSMLVSAESRINGQVLVAGAGWARRTAVVECEHLVRLGEIGPADVSAQRLATPLRRDGSYREFSDALESYAEFRDRVVGDLRQP